MWDERDERRKTNAVVLSNPSGIQGMNCRDKSKRKNTYCRQNRMHSLFSN